MTFKDLKINEPILRAIEEKGYTVPTPIQEKAIPAALVKRDILGCAQTGTGKTASFAIPIIQHYASYARKSIQTDYPLFARSKSAIDFSPSSPQNISPA